MPPLLHRAAITIYILLLAMIKVTEMPYFEASEVNLSLLQRRRVHNRTSVFFETLMMTDSSAVVIDTYSSRLRRRSLSIERVRHTVDWR